MSRNKFFLKCVLRLTMLSFIVAANAAKQPRVDSPGQYNPLHQMLSPAQQQAQLQQRQNPQQLQQGQPTQRDATQAVTQLQTRVLQLETVVTRPDLTDADRAKYNVELESARRSLAGVVKVLLAAHSQGQNGAGSSGAGVELMRAQAIAMQKRNETSGLMNSPQYRTASPQQQQQMLQQYGSSLVPPMNPAGAALLRQSPSLAPSTLPSPAPSMTPNDSTTGASDGPPAKKPKKLTKKAQAALDLAAAQAAQSQLQSQVNTQAHQLQNQSQSQQALSQAMAHQLQQQQQQHQQQQGPSSSSAHAPPHHIPSSLNVTPSYPEAFSAPRPTLSLGLANSPVVSTPAITRHPGLGASQVADAMRGGGTRKDGRHKDLREDSKGRTVSKRKIRELVESVDPEERLNDDVEDVSVALFLQSEYVITNKDHDDSFYWKLRTSLSIPLRGSHVN